MIDFDTLLYDHVYAELGVAAVFTANSTDAVEATLMVIDKTADAKTGDFLDVQTVQPIAAVRMTELISNGAGLGDLDGGSLVLNGKTYRIESHQVKPAPTGESHGEVLLIMVEA